jgi:hypothetical protein
MKMFWKMFVPVALLLLVSYSMPALASPAIASRSEVCDTNVVVPEQKHAIDTAEILRMKFKDGEEKWTEICQKAGVKNASITARTAVGNAKSCIEKVIEFPKLAALLEEAYKLNSLNSILQYIKNNCELYTKLRECNTNQFLIDIEPCIIDEEKPWLYKLKRLDEAVVSFVCDNKGHNIDVFIEEKGFECIESKGSSFVRCQQIPDKTRLETETDFSFSQETKPFKTLFKSIFSSEKCKYYSEFSQCALEEMRTCSSPKPAILLESLYKTVVAPTCNMTVTP